MRAWSAHTTVACVVEQDGRYLMVEERDKRTGARVFNQPAGHLESGESLLEAALRETREETGWLIALSGVIGIALYTAPGSGETYHRTTFLGSPVQLLANPVIDPDILAVHWLDYADIRANSARMRSPLVTASIERHREGICYPLDLIHTS
tara:strand:+ start:65447 stop:65899 length:453 start_codon:yes stop_codon:yes gene_type:complete